MIWHYHDFLERNKNNTTAYLVKPIIQLILMIQKIDRMKLRSENRKIGLSAHGNIGKVTTLRIQNWADCKNMPYSSHIMAAVPKFILIPLYGLIISLQKAIRAIKPWKMKQTMYNLQKLYIFSTTTKEMKFKKYEEILRKVESRFL